MFADQKSPGLMGQQSTPYLPNEPVGHSRRRSVSQPASPLQLKSVSFTFNEQERSNGGPQTSRDHVADRGYETDDSDSTIDGRDRNYDSHRHRSRRFSVPHAHAHDNTTGMNNASSTRNHKPGRSPADILRDSDSESTIDLPDRFDAQGRKLPEKGDDPLADTMDQFFQNAFMNDKSHSRSTGSAW